jgi:hypothetical protein
MPSRSGKRSGAHTRIGRRRPRGSSDTAGTTPSVILTSLADAGLRLEFLHEFDFVPWPVDFLVQGDDGWYRLPPGTKGELPLYFSVKASKPLVG